MQPLAGILAAVLTSAAAMAAVASPVAINGVCSLFTADAYPGYDYCVNVLSSEQSAARDGRGFAILAANATAHNVTHTIGLIDNLVDGLTKCSDLYGVQMAEKVASALGDLRAGRDPVTNLMEAYGLGPLNCFMLLTESWGFSREPLAQENSDNMALALLAREIAMLITKSSRSSNVSDQHLAGAPASQPAAIINATCSNLVYDKYPGYDYCFSVLSSDPAAAASARDTRDLAIVATNATARNITSTVKLIQGLLSDLAECKLSYGGRMGKTVDSALGDLIAGRSPVGAANKLADASRDAIECDVVISRRRGATKNVLYQENAENFVSARFASNMAMYAVN
ncbi:uncharacterized protein LOC123440310 [Hordeum vulgare subsp. vulgare]|uniref:Pectinesterase inhibitor domain-containing protein n=1 Tax=Hordeum vulgare subsp. vulgare TaxID=112509 RepID=A0A8I6XR38_HORVV|nr:uncharacterized protein LOC123440310 [Hordeum vulgare subsp. vulgare]